MKHLEREPETVRLADLSIRNPVFAVMVGAAMIVFGWMGYREMGISQFPEIDFPVVSIVITREAASPEIMDGDVTDVVEDAVASVEGVDYTMSESLEGRSITTVYFQLGRDIDVAMQDVQNAVSAARRKLPIDIDPPVISKINPANLPVVWLTLSGAFPVGKLGDLAEKELKPLLSSLPGVGGVQFAGLQERNVRVHVDRDKLRQFNLSAEDVRLAIQRQHAELPAGYIKSQQVEFNLRVMGEAATLAELGRLIVFQKSGQTVRLEDVAVVADSTVDKRGLARYNRLPAVAIGIRKAIGGNLVSVCDAVRAEMPRLARLLPPGVDMAIPVDSSRFVRENIDELKLTLILGVVLTAIVCYLFLGSLETTVNICLSIPTSLLGTFFFLNYGARWIGMEPFTLNLMTLLGLSLSVGVVVDDAILVLENIHRHREMGKDAKKSARDGSREIGFAALAATLSILAIFMPVAFLSGTIGRFFFQFGVTVGVAVMLSLVSALTITPMLCSLARAPGHAKGWRVPCAMALFLASVLLAARFIFASIDWLTPWLWPLATLATTSGSPTPSLFITWPLETAGQCAILIGLFTGGPFLFDCFDRVVLRPFILDPTSRIIDGIAHYYGVILGRAIALWPLVLALSLGLILFTASFFVFGWLGRELIPSEDQSRLVVRIIGPVDANIEQISDLLSRCEDHLASLAEVEGILTTVGTDSGLLMNEADLFVQLVPRANRRHTQRDMLEIIRHLFSDIRDIQVVVRDQSTEGFTAQEGFPVDFSIQGNWEQVPELARELISRMQSELDDTGRPIFQDIDTSHRPGKPELRIYPDRDKLALLGIPVSRLADSMNLLVGGERVGKFTDRGRRYDIRVKLREQQTATPEELMDLNLRLGGDRLVPVKDLVDLDRVRIIPATPVITRYNHQRNIAITANPGPGVAQGEALDKARRIASEILPPQISLVELGNAQAMRETIDSLVFALILGIVVAYMILGVQFNSFIHPLTVLLAMPFALTGAVVVLWWCGDTLNMMSLIGLVLLMGLVKKNSIILVDYANHLASTGLSAEKAVLEASPVRLRPILMTSIATVAGAVPAAFGYGPGAETRAPMARAIIGGIIVSTLVTLILVPVFYVVVERALASLRLALAGDQTPKQVL